MSSSKEYKVWQNMRQRCSNPNTARYKYYGGRGIKVCDHWENSFVNFYVDMGPCPDSYSIERVDNDGDYTPDNCIWLHLSDQHKNKRVDKRKKCI